MNKQMINEVLKTVESLKNAENRDEVVTIIAKVVEGIDAIMELEDIDYSEVLAIKMLNAKMKEKR